MNPLRFPRAPSPQWLRRHSLLGRHLRAGRLPCLFARHGERRGIRHPIRRLQHAAHSDLDQQLRKRADHLRPRHDIFQWSWQRNQRLCGLHCEILRQLHGLLLRHNHRTPHLFAALQRGSDVTVPSQYRPRNRRTPTATGFSIRNKNFEGFSTRGEEPIDSPFKAAFRIPRGEHSQGYLDRDRLPFVSFRRPGHAHQQTRARVSHAAGVSQQPDPTDLLPPTDTHRADFRTGYFLAHELRMIGGYSRQFASTGNLNVWQTGVTYRFPCFPLGEEGNEMREPGQSMPLTSIALVFGPVQVVRDSPLASSQPASRSRPAPHRLRQRTAVRATSTLRH